MMLKYKDCNICEYNKTNKNIWKNNICDSVKDGKM